MSDVELKQVAKAYGPVQVIHGIDLKIEDGEFVVFVGPSGCGKSTLLRMIAGLETVSGGDLLLDGVRVNDTSAADRGLAMVFQSYALYPHMSVRQNLAFGLENSNMPKAEIALRVEEVGKMLQIDHLLERKPRQLSGGQRQRVAIGRAIVRRPGVFLLDEPLSNLDAELRVVMRTELAALHKRLKATMIYVTHDQVEAMTLADKIVVLRAGKVEQIGRPLDLYNRPANKFVAGFIGSPKMNFLDGTVIGQSNGHVSIRLADGAVIEAPVDPGYAQAGAAVTVGIRPQHVQLSEDGSGPKATVRHIEHLGNETVIYARSESLGELILTLPEQVEITSEEIALSLPLKHLHVFDADEQAVARV
ncbi:ABC transporter ATP-binding protein [Lacibacterium aquatile]|uniref:ABC transporter ATP-binding protein n=1 Tax=Lacibacterium aquatile TaxID=1168082 RepID=A0ABW5DLS8_9PROT